MIWVNVAGNLIHFEDGRPDRTIAVIQDITERKRIEAERQGISQQRQLALDAARMGWWHYDPITRISYWDDRYKEIFGVTGYSGPNDEILTRLHPDDLPAVWAKVEAALDPDDPQPYSAEYRINLPDGSVKWIEAHGLASFETVNGVRRATSLVGTVSDITERKKMENALRESEQRFRLALRNAPVSVAAQDRDLRYIWAYNQQTALPENIIGHFDDEIFTPEETEYVTSIKRRVLEEKIEFREQMWFNRPSGRIFLDVCWEPIFDKGGRVIGVASATVDLTPIKLAEEALKASLAEKEVLLKEIHHRVKNNMQVISSLVSLQADKSQDSTIRENLQDVSHRVRSMAMVHEKLYQSTDLARIDFSQYAESLLSYLWRSYGSTSSNIRLIKDLKPVWLPVNEAVPCGLILNELISNALKHAFPDHGVGEVVVTLQGSEKTRVLLSVRDYGKGLPAGFDWKEAGSLGLRLIQMLAGQLHADVKVVSDGGTEFRLIFERRL